MDFFHPAGPDPLKPSLFELVAQEQLRALLQPALKYVLAVFAQRHPRLLLRLVNRHEELYALAMLLVERHYLRTHNASFAENFYGLRRRRRPAVEMPRARLAAGSAPPEERLRTREVARSLLWLVGLPYVRAKAQDWFEDLGGGLDVDIVDQNDAYRQARALSAETVRGRLRRAYKALYPWGNSAFEFWLMVYNMAYLFDRTPFYRPWLSWIGVDVRRLGIEDLRPPVAAPRPALPPGSNSLPALLRLTLATSPRLLLDSLKVLLPTAIFFIRFLEWWYSPASPARALAAPAVAPAVPPPRLLPPAPDGLPVARDAYGACPLCARPLTNATALPSGYVFCYRCAHTHVAAHGVCPVTRMPASVRDLRKVLA